MRLLWFAVIVCAVRAQDVMQIVHQYSEKEGSQNDRVKDYTYNQHISRRILDRMGRVKSEKTEVYEVLIADGKRVAKLTDKNGKAVTEKMAAARQRELEQVVQRFPPVRFEDRYDKFDLEGEEEVNGRMAWVVTVEKKVKFPAFGVYDRSTLSAKFWIDQSEFECAKRQGDGVGTVIGVDGKSSLLSHDLHEYMRLADGVWLPARTVFDVEYDSPLALMRLGLAIRPKYRREFEVVYTDYKKFNVDSRIVALPANWP